MKGVCLLGFDTLTRFIPYSPGWVYYHISNAMQYSNTTMEIALVMYDPNTFFFVVTDPANFINCYNKT